MEVEIRYDITVTLSFSKGRMGTVLRLRLKQLIVLGPNASLGTLYSQRRRAK